jgi:non-canonical purine NTP pyrophosphatase (RdgB/HAM1 family)
VAVFGYPARLTCERFSLNEETMLRPKLTFVTSNADKFSEIHSALADCPVELEHITLDLPEIQAIDPAEVAAYKAQRAYEQMPHGWVLVEDSGLGLDAWNGYPGALIKWIEIAMGEPGLCRQLDAWSDRSATATVALCLHDGKQCHTFIGSTHGQITHEPRGTYGFGWDSIFQPDGYTLTYGEMPRAEKMKISMRALALAKLRAFWLDG